ncbi:MAG: hypothetical protein LUF02_05115 [Erysipelotrichaceae bacterium]|nr:hypothetical protein [Erysipelotrichaceae bacterium]
MYYYVMYDESDVIREEYAYKVSHYKLNVYDEIVAFDFVQQPKRVFNSDYVVEQMMLQLSIEDEVKDIIKRDFKIIPLDHLQFLIDNDIKIVKSSCETFYSGQFKTIYIDVLQSGEGIVAHELGHAFVDINNLYRNNELKVLMQNIVNNVKNITSKIINNDSYMYVESEKFIRKYQGRTYILEKDYYGKHIQLVFSDLEEYISVGFATFVINPMLLYNKDKELYEFIARGGLLNENV